MKRETYVHVRLDESQGILWKPTPLERESGVRVGADVRELDVRVNLSGVMTGIWVGWSLDGGEIERLDPCDASCQRTIPVLPDQAEPGGERWGFWFRLGDRAPVGAHVEGDLAITIRTVH